MYFYQQQHIGYRIAFATPNEHFLILLHTTFGIFFLCMFLKLLFHRKWLDRFHSRPQTLAYCARLYASPYDPALPAGGSDENRLIVPNKHKRFLSVSIRRYPVLILYPKVLCIFVKTFRFALVLYVSNICFCILFSFNSISGSFLTERYDHRKDNRFLFTQTVCFRVPVKLVPGGRNPIFYFLCCSFSVCYDAKKESHIFPLFF